jgi:single-strand DNA-binding protein
LERYERKEGRTVVNSVVLVGRTGQDPEIKYFDSGSVKARFSIAVDRNFSKENKETDWFNVEVWGRQAEFVGEWVKKGQLLAVTGQLEVQRWTDQAGNPKEYPIIKASDIRLEGSKRDNMAGANSY